MMIVYILIYKKDLRFYIPFAPKLICVRHWRAAPALITVFYNLKYYYTVQKKAGNKRTLTYIYRI